MIFFPETMIFITENVDEIMAQPEINGALVGGASLDPKGFARIVNYQ